MYRVLIGIFLTVCCLFVHSAHSTVLLIVREGDTGQQVARQIAKGIKDEEVVISNDYKEGDYSLVVALEDKQLDGLPVDISAPVLGAYVSIGYNRSHIEQARFIYRSPHPSQLRKPINALFRGYRVGYIYSDYSKPYFDMLQLDNSGVSIRSSGNIYRDIAKLLKKDIDLFLLFDDRTVFEDKAIRKVIETLYRDGVPVITTSPALKNAGPISTLSIDHSDYIKTVIDEINQAVRDVKTNRYSQEEYYSKKIVINMNDRMLDIFNLSLPSVKAREFYEQ